MNESPIRYVFDAGTRAILYSVDMALKGNIPGNEVVLGDPWGKPVMCKDMILRVEYEYS